MLRQMHTHTVAARRARRPALRHTNQPAPPRARRTGHDHPQPPHPVHALTSAELTGYRRQLEHAITGIDPAAPVQALLHRNLDQVLAEQAARAGITATGGLAGPASLPRSTARPGPPPAPVTPAEPAGRQLAAIADQLTAGGITCQLRRDGSTPSLTIEDPVAGPDGPTVIIDPGLPGGPAPWIDCTWTPAPGATPGATAAVIIAVLAAIRPAPGPA